MITRILIYIALIWSCMPVYGQQNLSPLPHPEGALHNSLPNGLSYILHPGTGNKTEFRLLIHAGSVQETEAERGVAHFLEHLVFNHTQDFPDGKLVDTLRSLGYRFGRDINAYTSYDRTVYELSILDRNLQSLALNLLKNILAKVEFRQADVEKERQIIIQEIRDFSPNNPFSEEKLEGSIYSNRIPIASEKDVYKLQLKELQHFYKQWYTAEMATLIVTGDFDVNQMESEIRRLYQELPGSGKREKRQNMDSFQPDFQHKLTQIQTEHLSLNTLERIQFADTKPLLYTADFKAQIIEELYQSYLLSQIARSSNQVHYSNIWYLPHQVEHSLEWKASSKEELVSQLSLSASMIGTLRDQPIHKAELDLLKEAYLKKIANLNSNISASSLANHYIDEAAVAYTYLDPSYRHQLSKQLMPEISIDDIQEMHQKIWFDNPQKTKFLFQRQALNTDSLSRYSLDSAWNAGIQQPLVFIDKQDQPTKTDEQQLYTWEMLPEIPFDPQVSIIQEKYFSELQLTEITLSNGIRVAIKPTTNPRDPIVYSYVRRGGLHLLPDSLYDYLQDANYFIGESWINGLSAAESREFESQLEISSLISLTDENLIVNISNTSAHLEDVFQWMYRRLYDYQVPTSDFEAYIQTEISNLGMEKKESLFSRYPAIVLKHQIADEQSKFRKAKELDQPADWEKIDLNLFFEIYDQQVREADQAYFIVSGPIQVEDVKQKALRYFSHIPTVQASSKLPLKEERQNLNGLGQAVPVVQKNLAFHPEDMNQRLDVALMFKGSIQAQLKEYIIAQLINEYFNTLFLVEAREKSGLVYSPYSEIDISFYPQVQSYLSLHFSAQQQDIPTLKKIAMELAQQLQVKHIDAQQLKALKRAIKTNKNTHLQQASSTTWVDKLREIFLNYESLASFNDYEIILEDISAEDIRQVSETIFSMQEPLLFYVKP